MNVGDVLNKCLLMDFLCVCVSHCPGGLYVPPGEDMLTLCCSLSLSGIQYRPGYNNWRLISGPRTRASASGQEDLPVAPGLSLQHCAFLRRADCVPCPFENGARERLVFLAVVLSLHHFATHSVLLRPPPAPISSSHPLSVQCCCSDGSG